MSIKSEPQRTGNSFWQVFRLVFVVFSLYLMGDTFFRWDGFRYHSTFFEFIPSVALASVLWSIVALLMSIMSWLLLNSITRVCHRAGIEITIEHLVAFFCILIISGVLVWEGKKFFLPLVYTSRSLKLIVFVSVFVSSLFLTRMIRNRTDRWMRAINERITPLTWLFGMLLLFSFPIVAYHAWFKDANNVLLRETERSSVPDRNRPNIILVTFDALAARDMELYGYDRETTPFITRWAKEATVFTNLQAGSNWTTPTTASLMTGKRVWSHQAYLFQGEPPLKSETESLPALMRKNGYFNMAFIANPIASVKTLGISGSFDIAPSVIEFSTPRSLFGDGIEVLGAVDKLLYRLFADKIKLYDWIVKKDFIFGRVLSFISRNISETTVPPEKAFNRFFEALNSRPPGPFFAWIHVLPPHAPYLPPAPFMEMYNSSPAMRTYKNQLETYELRTKYHDLAHFPAEVQPLIEILRGRYDEFIRYCDSRFEEFVNQLMIREEQQNTVIILSSDHGQSFEHAYLAHGGPHLYEPVTNIPLIVKEPLQSEGRVVNDLTEQIDIPATILDFAGIPPPLWMEGRSLAPLIHGKQLPSKAAFSMNFDKNRGRGQQITTGTIAVWEGDYKLINYLQEKKYLLFNINADRYEMNNIFEKEPETGRHLLNLIFENLDKANDSIRSGAYFENK